MGSLLFGRKLFGRHIFGGHFSNGGASDRMFNLVPGAYSIKIYNADGTKTAEFGSNVEANPVISLEFELIETGCGKITMKLGELPNTTALSYNSRIDVHLFGDAQPVYSGFIYEVPVTGSTARPYSFIGHGYYDQLDWMLVNKTYENMDIATIAREIITEYIEQNTDIVFRLTKITATGYVATKMRFANVSAKDAIKQLVEFAGDFVAGVDASREFFFKPVSADINEQARLMVGVHISDFEPKEDVSELVNYAVIKGSKMGANGSNVLATVQNSASQTAYGMRQAVWEIPSALSETDATRWGLQELGKYKEPKRSATIKGLDLEYRNVDGSFNVRKITPDGQAAITDRDGNVHVYPITKMAYKISKDGISATITLGEPPTTLADWFVKMDRDTKNSEYIQDANNVQLSGGTV